MSQKHIVITGSTRGIGFGLAEAFLDRDCSVMVSGRKAQDVHAIVLDLQTRFSPERVAGQACDVNMPDQLQALWDSSTKKFGKVDVWINNAGWSGNMGEVWALPPKEISGVISTNLLGTIYGAQTAMRGMLTQGYGAIYNMEGMGGDGRKHAGLTIYGTSKSAVHYFTESMALEAKGTPILIGSLRPGMVITGLITDRYIDKPDELERVKRVFNIIADRVENVSPWLVKRMLANRKNGVILAYSSMWRLILRFATQPFVRRNLFPS